MTEARQLLGQNLRNARKKQFPEDDMRAFALRVGVSCATLQKMEKGELSVSTGKYYVAAKISGLTNTFKGGSISASTYSMLWCCQSKP